MNLTHNVTTIASYVAGRVAPVRLILFAGPLIQHIYENLSSHSLWRFGHTPLATVPFGQAQAAVAAGVWPVDAAGNRDAPEGLA